MHGYGAGLPGAFCDLVPGGYVPDYLDGRARLGEARQKALEYVFAGRNRIDETTDLARSVTDGRYLYTRNFLPQYMPLKYQKYVDVADISKTIREDGAEGELDSLQRRLLVPQPAETYFYLELDPWELDDLIGDPAQQARIAEMRAALQQIQDAGARRHEFLSVLRGSLSKIEEIADDNRRYNCQSSAETSLYLEGAAPLFYGK